jgi:hypothetical protein
MGKSLAALQRSGFKIEQLEEYSALDNVPIRSGNGIPRNLGDCEFNGDKVRQ